jgi:hypothetical protein
MLGSKQTFTRTRDADHEDRSDVSPFAGKVGSAHELPVSIFNINDQTWLPTQGLTILKTDSDGRDVVMIAKVNESVVPEATDRIELVVYVQTIIPLHQNLVDFLLRLWHTLESRDGAQSTGV